MNIKTLSTDIYTTFKNGFEKKAEMYNYKFDLSQVRVFEDLALHRQCRWGFYTWIRHDGKDYANSYDGKMDEEDLKLSLREFEQKMVIIAEAVNYMFKNNGELPKGVLYE